MGRDCDIVFIIDSYNLIVNKIGEPMDLTVKQLVDRSFLTAFEHGWWEDCITTPDGGVVEHRPDGTYVAVAVDVDEATKKIPEKLMLIVTEVAEAMESYRDPHHSVLETWYGDNPSSFDMRPRKPEGMLSELADVYIRIGDLVGALGAGDEFVKVVEEKLKYNESRPYRHGGRRA